MGDQRDPQHKPELEEAPEEALNTETEEGHPDTAAEASNDEIAALQQALEKAKEDQLRAAAEMQNIRRRAEQDVERAHKFGLEKIVGDMLPVADNLERALEAATSSESTDVTALVEGVELTLKTLMDALNRHKVAQVDPEGEPFNPELHQAMSMVPNPNVEANTVINVYQKGYTLNGRLVRPAMVVVAKGESP